MILLYLCSHLCQFTREKRGPCHYLYATGTCKLGNRCQFSHKCNFTSLLYIFSKNNILILFEKSK